MPKQVFDKAKNMQNGSKCFTTKNVTTQAIHQTYALKFNTMSHNAVVYIDNIRRCLTKLRGAFRKGHFVLLFS